MLDANFVHINLPPRQPPNANAHTNGCSGKFNAFLPDKDMAILIIIVVNGILSTNADASADICIEMKRIEMEYVSGCQVDGIMAYPKYDQNGDR